MPSVRRLRKRARRAAGKQATAEAVQKPTPTRSPGRRSCDRCGAGCRTEKPLYGWVCANCAKELDTYYQIKIGLSGGSVVSAYRADARRGTVPRPGFPDDRPPP